jgi:hypothetical protein
MTITWSSDITYVTGGKHSYPKEEGVYIIFSRSNKKPQYVGQGNIRDRMSVHESNDEPNSCVKSVMKNRDNVLVRYAVIPSVNERNNVEYTAVSIAGLDNLCNEIMPPEGKVDYTLNIPFLNDLF